MGIEKKSFSVRLDEEVIERLRVIAHEENRPISNLVETILKRYLVTQEQESDALKRYLATQEQEGKNNAKA